MKIPEDTLYLPIKQVYFDQIVEGTKKIEYREVVGWPLGSRYLQKDEKKPKHYKLNPDCTEPDKEYYWDDYNGGKYPFLPRPFKYMYMAVGYETDRDTATVEITGITFHPERIKYDGNRNPCFCRWIMEIHLGRVIEVYRKRR